MKFIISVLLTGLLAFAGGLYLPWWSLALAAFIVALLVHQRAGKAFLAGFTGVFLLWAVLAWVINNANDGQLAKKIAELLPLGGNTTLLILLTALVGGLIGGLGAITGSFFRSSRKPASRI
jgi:hypothetical protein